MSEVYGEDRRMPETLEEALWVIDGLTDVVERLRRQTLYDDLISTMLNKRATQRLIENYIDNNRYFGLFLIDIDHFKQVNDILGHVEGDRLLVHLGELLHENFRRATDALGLLFTEGRVGGDEFVIMVDVSQDARREMNPFVQMDKIYELLCSIEEQFLSQNLHLWPLGVGFSIGSAMFDPRHPVDAKTLYMQADEAMYEEKSERVLGWRQ